MIREAGRTAMRAGLGYVGHVLIFEEGMPLELLRRLRAEVHVKDGTWSAERGVGKGLVGGCGDGVCVAPGTVGVFSAGNLVAVRDAGGRQSFAAAKKLVDRGHGIADSGRVCGTILASMEVAMFRLLRSITLKQCFTEQVPALVGAAVIAELFYKFHSFLLETGAFLAIWFVFDLAFQGVASVLAHKVPVASAEQRNQA